MQGESLKRFTTTQEGGKEGRKVEEEEEEGTLKNLQLPASQCHVFI